MNRTQVRAPSQNVTDLDPEIEMRRVIERFDKRLPFLIAELDEDEPAPTDVAVQNCRGILRDAALSIPHGYKLRFPDIGSTGRGDLLCHWGSKIADLVIYFAPEGEMSVTTLERDRTPEEARSERARASDCVKAIERYVLLNPPLP